MQTEYDYHILACRTTKLRCNIANITFQSCRATANVCCDVQMQLQHPQIPNASLCSHSAPPTNPPAETSTSRSRPASQATHDPKPPFSTTSISATGGTNFSAADQHTGTSEIRFQNTKSQNRRTKQILRIAPRNEAVRDNFTVPKENINPKREFTVCEAIRESTDYHVALQ